VGKISKTHDKNKDFISQELSHLGLTPKFLLMFSEMQAGPVILLLSM
jgi:hypothetical protein